MALAAAACSGQKSKGALTAESNLSGEPVMQAEFAPPPHERADPARIDLDIGRTEQYHLGLPKAPVFHPYHPLGNAAGNTPPARTNHGAPAVLVAAKFPLAFYDNLPLTIRETLAQQQIPNGNVDILFDTQDLPWEDDTPINFRPHYWTDPDAPYVGTYKIQSNLQVGFFAPDRELSIAGQSPGELRPHTILVHPYKADRESLILSSPDNMQVPNLNWQNSSSMWSVVIKKEDNRAAVTLHWLLNDRDQAQLAALTARASNMTDLVTKLNQPGPGFIGTTRLDKLNGLIQGSQGVNSAERIPKWRWDDATLDAPESTGTQDVVLHTRHGLFAFNKGRDNRIRWGTLDRGRWNFRTIESPTCVADSLAGVVSNNTAHIFATGTTDGQPAQSALCHLTYNDADGNWLEEQLDVGESTGHSISATVNNGALNVFNQGSAGPDGFAGRYGQHTGGGWNFSTIADDLDPANHTATIQYGDQEHVVYQALNGSIRHKWSNPGSHQWHESTEVPDQTNPTPPAPHTALALSNYGGQFHLLYKNTSQEMMHRWHDPRSGWAAETLSADMANGSGLAIANFGDQFHLTGAVAGNALLHKWYDPGTGTWSQELLDSGSVSAIDGLAMAQVGNAFQILARGTQNNLRSLRWDLQ